MRTGATRFRSRGKRPEHWRNRQARHIIFYSILVGYYEGGDLLYAGRIRNGFAPASRRTVFSNFEGLWISKCPFRNLPESGKGRWARG